MRIRFLRVPLGLLMVSLLPGLAQEKPRKVSRAEGESAILSKVHPVYPPIARQLKIQGSVELEAVVTPTGDVEEVAILSGSPVLTKPAVEALKKWKFRPFLSDSLAVRTLVPISILFELYPQGAAKR